MLIVVKWICAELLFLTLNLVVGGVKDLGIEEKFNGTISRIRRGDVEMLANPNMRLQQGDRVRVIVPGDRLKELNNYFGDSVQGFVDINPVALGLVWL